MPPVNAKIIGISRHRIVTDGEGVTTLVAFHDCPLRCKFCLNPQSLGSDDRFKEYTPQSLYDKVRIDELYFIATNGGVTFGGGEPALRPDFISDFRKLCGQSWRLSLETSLNVPSRNIETLMPAVDSWIIDIKDLNPDIYRQYTGIDNSLLLTNLRLLAQSDRLGDCTIRLPLIPGHNTSDDREKSHHALAQLGYTNFDLFTYQIRNRTL